MSTLPMIERLSVEILAPPPGAGGLRLDHDELGVGQLGRRADLTPQWLPVLTQATGVGINRGGSVKGVTVSPQVGTLSLTALDSPTLAQLTRGTPIRVRRLRDYAAGYGQGPYGQGPYGAPGAGGELLFTGWADTVRTEWQRPTRPGRPPQARTTVTAVDAVQVLANTQRYGAVISYDYPWADHETLGQRAQRLLRPTGLPWTGPPAMAPTWTPTGWAVGNNIGHGPATHYTVRTEPSEDGPGYTTMTYRPGVPYTAGVLRYGVSVPAAVRRLTLAAWVRPKFAGLADHPTPLQVAAVIRRGSTDYAATTLTLDRTGAWTHVELTADLPEPPPGTSSLSYYLALYSLAPGDAPGNGGVAQVFAGISATGAAHAFDPATSCAGAGYPLGSLVYESTLANHLDVAVNSTRGAWWVDATGTVQVRACRHGTDTPTLLQLTDQPGAGYSYVALTHELDSDHLINELTLTNRGRREDPDQPGTFVADDRALGPFRRWGSVAAYGPAAGEVDTGLAYAEQLPAGMYPAETLARAYLAPASRPVPFPRTVRLYRDPDDPPLPPIDVMDPAEITFNGTTYTAQVARITHDITPERWHTTLDLVER